MVYRISSPGNGTICIDGAPLDPAAWCVGPAKAAETGPEITPLEAFQSLSESNSLRHLVVGVIGPREATVAQESAAEAVGRAMGQLGLTLICGGRTGVMRSVSAGCSSAGGLMIGILPGSHPDEANEFVGVPLPTGLGEARNMVIAKAARVLIAVGGSYGTLSEVAFGLHFSKAVIGLEGAPDVEGVEHAPDVPTAIDFALQALAASAVMKSQQFCKLSDTESS
ncbi:MAG: DNA-binding protein [Pseudomonadota bacterium]